MSSKQIRFLSSSIIAIALPFFGCISRNNDSTDTADTAAVSPASKATLIVNDGTWAKYDNMSVVSRLHRKWSAGPKMYTEGVKDGVLATDLVSIGNSLYSSICGSPNYPATTLTYFAGYSRGALVVLHAADRLRRECPGWSTRRVHFFLVDAVDHSVPWTDGNGRKWPRELPTGTTGTHFIKNENFGKEDWNIYATRNIAGAKVVTVDRIGRATSMPNGHTYIAFEGWSIREILTEIMTQCIQHGVGRCITDITP